MKLSVVRIQNYRGIKDLELDLDDVTVLIGENNSGKTSILKALQLCLRDLGPRRRAIFDTFDFHLKDDCSEPSAADAICITLTFSEMELDEWDQQLIVKLNQQRILQVDPGSGLSHVRLRVMCWFDPTDREIKQDWHFLTPTGDALTNIAEFALVVVQNEVSYYYLAAVRDAAQHFDAKGPYWRPFLKDSQLPADKKADIEAKLKDINDLVVASHASFDQARNSLQKVQEFVPLAAGDVVSIEAVPGRMFDLLAKAQIYLGAVTGAKIPVGRHGEGTQSLAVLMLFSAFLDVWRRGSPVVALEEPEAHLHPSAVRTLWSTVHGIPGQKIVSTHSGDLLSAVPAASLRRLAKTADGIKVFRLKKDTLSRDEERQFNFHIRMARGELLFARCWLLVEGETEVILITELARHLGINLEQCGVRCVPHRHAGIALFLKVATDLGICWCVLADNDGQGKNDQRHVTLRCSEAVNLDNVLYVVPEDNIEEHLCASGFGAIYESYLSHQTSHRVTAGREDPQYWPQVLKAIHNSLVKPAAAIEAVNKIRAGELAVPPLLETAIRKAVAIAGGS